MSLQLNTPPAAEPVSLAEAKAHLKMDAADDDALIATLIAAARARAEWHTGRAFVTQGWTLWLDRWPGDGCVEIPLPPLQGVASVTHYACDDSATVLDAGDYQVAQGAPARVVLKSAASPANLRAADAVAIAFTAGYGNAAAVPALVRQAILQIVAGLYAHRGDDGLPPDALALLEPYRILKL
jgi:uncharacterized phiE125 gp8 family phage protein